MSKIKKATNLISWQVKGNNELRFFCNKINQNLTNIEDNTNIIENPKDIQLTNYINSKLANKLTNEEYLKEIEEMKPTLNPSDPEYFDKLKLMTRQEQRNEFYKHLVAHKKFIKNQFLL